MIACSSDGGADFCGGFGGCGRSFGGLTDGVGDGPCCAGDGDADGVARPIEVIALPGEDLRNPEKKLEDHDLGSEQARRERGQDAGEDGHGGPEKAQRSGVGPEHPGRRQPTRDRAQQAGHVNDVDDSERNGAYAEEEHEEGPAARNG